MRRWSADAGNVLSAMRCAIPSTGRGLTKYLTCPGRVEGVVNPTDFACGYANDEAAICGRGKCILEGIPPRPRPWGLKRYSDAAQGTPSELRLLSRAFEEQGLGWV